MAERERPLWHSDVFFLDVGLLSCWGHRGHPQDVGNCVCA